MQTSYQHKTGKSGPQAYDINSRAALACLHTGVGQTHLDGILATMNIPTMSRASFKTREREAGTAVESIAKVTCQQIITSEKVHAISTGATPDENHLIPVPCSYDMGWQKRGKGYNSNTGQGAVMGLHTGKVMDYTTRNKTCRTCQYAKQNNTDPPHHDCRMNHAGSSKSMEPLSAVELFQNAPKHQIKYSVYTGDEDSTTECYIHQQVPYGVEKFSDIVHIKRSLTTRLYNLSKSEKFLNCSPLSQKVIEYLVKCFSIAINQNKENPKLIQMSLKAIVPHAFGKHNNCDEQWCGYKQDATGYRHTYLPYGKDLHGDALQDALEELFSQYYNDEMVKKLAPAANSQRNESFNSVVGSKAPKIRCYGGSESNDFRVACAVAQTNIGHQYVDRTLEALGIEPGRNCTGHNLKMDRKRCHDSIRKSNIKFKNRRNQLHSRRISNTARKEKQEGTTYQTNVGLIQGMNVTSPHESTTEDVHGLSDISEETLMMYESTVSPFTSRPACTNVAYDQNTFYNFVIFDLETNTTGKAAEICQLSAVDQSGRSSFSEYALPVKQIDKYASRVNKLSVKIVNGQRTLFKETQQLVTLTLDELLSRFTRFLESLINCYQRLTDQNICTVLLGHNTKRFDIPVLLRNSTNSFKEKLQSIDVLFGDTLSLFEHLVNSKQPDLQQPDGKFSALNQPALYQCLFGEEFDAHDALEDVKALRRMIFSSKLRLSEEIIFAHCRPISYRDAFRDLQYLDQRNSLMKTFEFKLYNPAGDGDITKSMAEKIAGSGLSYDDLAKLFANFGRNGLIAILSKPPTANRETDRPRVTKTTRIITAIAKHFERNQRRVECQWRTQ